MNNRTIPLDKTYLSEKNVDYKIYSFLQSISHMPAHGKSRLIYRKDSQLGKLTNRGLLSLFNNNVRPADQLSDSTFRRRMSLFKKVGLIADDAILDSKGVLQKVLVLSLNFEIFQHVPDSTLKYLADTASSEVIKIYAYLLNKYLWKAKTSNSPSYTFTLKELAKEIGLSISNNGNTTKVRNCLISLQASELITFESFYNTRFGMTPLPQFKLINANFTSSIIRKGI